MNYFNLFDWTRNANNPPISNKSPTSTIDNHHIALPCVEQYCLDGEVFNETSCKCEPVISTVHDYDRTKEATNHQTSNCTVECPPGKSLDTDKCTCTCTHTVRCIGLKKFDFNKCICKCIHPYACRTNEYFNAYHCVCVPIYPYIPNEQQSRVSLQRNTFPPPPPAPQQQQLCRLQQCPGNKRFDMQRCECYCPSEMVSRQCAAVGKRLELNTCECMCPAYIALTCNVNQSYDNNDCSCKCRIGSSSSTCNSELQVFNPNSCQCECQRVYIRLQGSENGGFFIQRNKRSNEKHATDGVKKRMTRTRKKSRSKVRSRTTSHGSESQESIQPSIRLLVSLNCPRGTTADQNTCFCI